MEYRDILLAALTYPDATPNGALSAGVALARRFGPAVTALILQTQVKAPHNAVANALIDLDGLARGQAADSAERANGMAHTFLRAAEAAGLSGSTIVERTPQFGEADRICRHARTRDLCLMPIGPVVHADISMAEAVLFDSGRPLLVFPETAQLPEGDAFESVTIAWDGSRAAARAVGDALPVLKRAQEVRILTVVDEKPEAAAAAPAELASHLRRHDIRSAVVEVRADDEPIGWVLRRDLAASGADLLVMGGYGHGQLREFVLGGATISMIEAPPCPVLMSH